MAEAMGLRTSRMSASTRMMPAPSSVTLKLSMMPTVDEGPGGVTAGAFGTSMPGGSATGDSLGCDEHHRVRLVEAGAGVVRPVLPVEVDAERAVPLVAEGRVVAQRTALRIDVQHVATVVAV